MRTNKWRIEELVQNKIVVVRVQDNIPVLEMIVSLEDSDELLDHDEAMDVAQQIIDEWNFTCDEIE
jgi:hypothetical protein